MGENADLLKVAEGSRTSVVATKIAELIRKDSSVLAQALGAGAVNQTVKAIVLARTYLNYDNFDIICVPAFTRGEFSGSSKTAMRFTVMKMPGELQAMLVSIAQAIQVKAELIRVAAASDPKAVAGAIAGIMREQEFAEIQVVGAGAVNQAVKAIVISRNYLSQDGFDIVVAPQFTIGDLGGVHKTAVHFTVMKMPEQVHDLLISLS